jgi:hypothetical protein
MEGGGYHIRLGVEREVVLEVSVHVFRNGLSSFQRRRGHQFISVRGVELQPKLLLGRPLWAVRPVAPSLHLFVYERVVHVWMAEPQHPLSKRERRNKG